MSASSADLQGRELDSSTVELCTSIASDREKDTETPEILSYLKRQGINDVIRLQTLTVSSRQQNQQPIEVSPSRKVVLPIGVGSWPQGLLESDQWHGMSQKERKSFRKMSRVLEKMLQSKDQESCLKVAAGKGFSWNSYQEQADRFQKDYVSRVRFEGRVVRSQFRKKIISDSRHEILSSNDSILLKKALTDPSVREVFIIAHAKSNGKLVDSDFNELPVDFFNEISPSIERIVIFSCYADQVVRNYDLARYLAETPSQHEKRDLMWVKATSIGGELGKTPIAGLGAFLDQIKAHDERRGVPHILEYLDVRQVEAFQIPKSARRCDLVVRGLSNQFPGAFVSFNRRTVGFVHAFSNHITFECSAPEMESLEIWLTQNNLMYPLHDLSTGIEVDLIRNGVPVPIQIRHVTNTSREYRATVVESYP